LNGLKEGIESQNEKTPQNLRTSDFDPLYTGGMLVCTIPTRRRDLRTAEDLIEEVGRIYGYDKIKPVAIKAAVQTPNINKQRFFERQLKNVATANGFSEIRGYSFHSEKDAEILGLKKLKHIELLNPASPEQAMLRNTLAVGILKAGRKSLSYFKEVRIFEIGRIYRVKTPQNLRTSDFDPLYTEGESALPQEILSLASGVFSKEKDGTQFYEIKGLLDVILENLGISGCYYDDNITDDERPKGMPKLHPSRQALLKTVSGKVLGWLGEVDKKTAKHFGLKNVRGAIFEIEVDNLMEEINEKTAFQPLSKFPFMERDLSIIVGEKLRAKEVEDVLFKSGGRLIKDVDLFDLYQNKETGERSMAFHLIFGDETKTLQAKEVDETIAKVIEVVESELGVEVRK
jgi:phenylalanyl-tRNA synthetase beta chain